jgi:large subunit ribosomal protein L21
MFAVIKTGGKQYIVEPKTKLHIEKVEGNAGDAVVFDEVLLVSDGEKTTVGNPIVSEKKVTGVIVKQTRDEKKLVFRYHSKTRYRKTKGHKQPLTEIEITNIA